MVDGPQEWLISIDKMKKKNRPILVTGLQWSGTTWLGECLNKNNSTGIVYEPFNPGSYLGYMNLFNIRYKYLNEEIEYNFEEIIRNSINFEYSLVDGMKLMEGGKLEKAPWGKNGEKRHHLEVKDIPKSIYRYIKSHWNRLSERRPIIKDPLALLSAEYIAKTFNAHVVITVRHPAAFVESALRRLSDQVNAIGQLRYNQPEVIDLLFHPFEEDIRSWQRDLPLIEQTTLFWRCLNHVVRTYQKRNQEWRIVRHEDLVADPRAQFQSLYAELNLDWSQDVQDKILNNTDKSAAKKWKENLSSDQIEYIYNNSKDVWSSFYEESEWE